MSEQVHIRVQEGRRDDWREHAEDAFPEKYGNLSAFIRHAVERQIEQDRNESGDSSPDSRFDIPDVDASDRRVDELLEAVRSIRTDVEGLNDNVERAVDAVHAQEGVDPDVTPDVFELLPEGKENAVTADDLADSIPQFSPAEVRFALENLRRNVGEVEAWVPADEGIDTGGVGESYAEHWYREE